MEDQSMKEQELIKEISELKQRIKELEQSDSRCKRAENLFRQDHELYLDLVNNQPAGIFRIRVYPREQWQNDAWSNPKHPPYSVDLASNRFCEILGIDRQVFENNPGIVEELIYPKDKEDFTRRSEEANAKMVLFQWEGRLFIRGEILWVHLESIPRLIENGVVLWTGILYDITDRKRAEDALRESEATYKTILMASPDDITIADLSGRIIMVSDAAHKMFGYDQEEGPGMSVMDFIAPEEHERARANIVKMLSENYPGPNEYHAIRKDRSCFDIEVNNALIRDRQGNPIRMVLIARDITERRKAEREREELIAELQKALAEIKTLRGIVPICASCKKIRDDKGYWEQVESFVSKHTEAQFSHGICPDCTKIYFPSASKDTKSNLGV